MRESLTKDFWYIDVRGQVQQMAAWDIIEALISHEFKIIFRVSKDKVKWNAICNESYFEDAVQELIKLLSAEATKYGEEAAASNSTVESTGFHNIKNLATGITEQLQHANQLQEINVHLQSLRTLASDMNAKKKLIIDTSAPRAQEEMHADDRNVYINSPTFMERFKTYIDLKNPSIRVRAIVATLVLLITLGITGKYQAIQREKEEKVAREQAQQALQAKAIGEYDKALAIFGEIENTKSLDAKTLLQFAETYIQAKDYPKGTLLINQSLKRSSSAHDTAYGNSLLGFISMKNNNPAMAESYYKQSVAAFDIYSSLYNLAIYYLDNNQPEQSEALLLRALKLASNINDITLLALFEAALQMDLKEIPINNDTPLKFARLRKVNALLENARSPSSPYYEELLVAQIAIATNTNDHESFNSLLNDLLNLDPKRTVKRNYIFLVDYHRTSWSHINSWCLSVYKNKKINNLKAAYYASCVARSKGLKEALPYAQYAYLNTEKPSPNLRGFYGYLVLASENIVGAKQILREGDTKGSLLAQDSISKICATHPDSTCSAKN